MDTVKNLSVVFEEYDVDHMCSIPNEVISLSLMSPVERAFINGLIRYFRPQRILELGVDAGAGSAVILNAISDMPNATLTSFDVAISPGRFPDKKIGFAVDCLPEELRCKWKFYHKRDFSSCADSFFDAFDLVVIDTAHIHPVECLNFISVLPYLSENAIVLFHDLNLFVTEPEKFRNFPAAPFASKIVFDAIVGDKLYPEDKGLKFKVPCLAAVQITNDTWKYIDNVFSSLTFPWANYVDCVLPYLKDIAKIIRKSYSGKQYDVFLRSVIMNTVLLENNLKYNTDIDVFLAR